MCVYFGDLTAQLKRNESPLAHFGKVMGSRYDLHARRQAHLASLKLPEEKKKRKGFYCSAVVI